jgi:disulfide bond formation protein DsbB
MNKYKKFEHFLSFLLLLVLAPLVFAYLGQYFFDLQPCVLCLYQRSPFFISICLIVIHKIFRKLFKTEIELDLFFKKLTFFLVIFLLVVNCAIAFYHIGVEKGIFIGPTRCLPSNNLNNITNLEELTIVLAKTKAIDCSQPVFILPFISMALANFIYCFTLILVSTFFYKKLKI